MPLPATHPEEPNFGYGVPLENGPTNARALYHALLKIDEYPNFLYPAYSLVKNALGKIQLADDVLHLLSSDKENILDWVKSLAESKKYTTPSISRRRLKRIAREYAPYALIDGCWLQNITRLPTSERESGAILLRQFMARVGIGQEGLNTGDRYSIFLRGLGTQDFRADDITFSETTSISSYSFEFALLFLAIGFFPQTFYPEILGINLWCACAGRSFLLSSQVEMLQAMNADITYLSHQDHSQSLLALEAVEAFLAEEMDSLPSMPRVLKGVLAAYTWQKTWEDNIRIDVLSLTARDEMVRLIKKKSKHAIGYHAHIKMGGRSLDSYFAGSDDDHRRIVDELGKSRFVAPGKPDESKLLTEITAFGGAMFDIFTAEERDIITEWIQSLANPKYDLENNESNSLCDHRIKLIEAYSSPQNLLSLSEKSKDFLASIPSAERTYYLLNIDLFPIARPFSQVVAARGISTLKAAISGNPKAGKAPISYSEYLRLMDEMHHEQVTTYDATRGRKKSREALVSETFSNAVAALTDGSWMQGFSDIARIGWEEYKLLFSLYASELGDGLLERNHNVIARSLIRSMGYELPSTHTPSFFSYTHGKCAHELTQMYLAITINHRKFLPELLGLNLGIESFGVGNRYREMLDALMQYGFDGTHMMLHNSIDNYSTGHTRMAVDAIYFSIDRVARTSPEATENWLKRVWEAFLGIRTIQDLAWETF